LIFVSRSLRSRASRSATPRGRARPTAARARAPGMRWSCP